MTTPPDPKNANQDHSLGTVRYSTTLYRPCGEAPDAAFFNRHLAQLFSFFRLLPYPIQVFDNLGTAIMVNDAFLRMYEIDSEERYCGRYNILEDPLIDSSGARKCVERIFKGETAFFPCAYGAGYPNYSREGTRRRKRIYSAASFIPVAGPKGTISHVISIRTDLTEQQRTEEKLRSSEETFRSMIHAIQEAALLIRSDGEVLAANTAVTQRLNETTDSIIGKNIYTILPPEEAAVRKEAIAKLTRTGKPLVGEIRREDRILISSVNPVFSSDGKIDRIAIFATDITRLKNAQEQIRASEERMRALLEGSSDMIQVLDKHGTITYVSPSMKKILGYDPRQPLGEPVFKIIHPDDLPGVHLKFAGLLTHPETPVKVQCRCLHQDGTWRHIEAWARNFLSNPAIDGIVLNIRDISEHIQAQELIQSSEAKFRGIVEQSRDGVTIIDATGTIIIYNRAQEKITGIPAGKALGQKIWDLQYGCMTGAHKARITRKQFKAMYHKFLKSGDSPWMDSVFDTEMVRADGTHLHLQTLLFPLRVNDTVTYASFNRDVTAQKKAQQELLRREAELEERTALLKQKNMALRELMSQVESEKKRAGEQFQANIEQLVLPVLHRLKARCCDADRVYAEMLEENLREVATGPGLEFSNRMHHLTQREIEMCTMIKQGITSKEIGRLLHISSRTVETHRNRIRRKLKIDDPGINLATWLKNSMTAVAGLKAPGT